MNHKTWIVLMAPSVLLPLSMVGACGSETDNVASDPTGAAASSAGGQGGILLTTGGGGSGAGGSGGGPIGGSGGVAAPTEIAECQGHIYPCGDLLDNDGDGLIDSQDPDCLGPCDATEDSYYGGIPGQPGPPCALDCYFDQDSGSGNDQCYWDHACDPLSQDPHYYPGPWEGDKCGYTSGDVVIQPIAKTCDVLLNEDGQLQACLDYCLPLTPNGCDCFGCCELPAESGDFVWLGSEGVTGSTVCTANEVDNPEICHPCTPVADCWNSCEPCELCVGKTTLPPECFDNDAGTQQCPPGLQPCGLPGQDPCPAGYFCTTGCCQAVPR